MQGSLGAYRQSMADLSNLSPQAQALVAALRAANVAPNLSIISGYRSPQRNADVGGAENSRHLTGDAIDISGKGLTDAQRAALLQAAVTAGARGVGIYPGGSLHFDMRSTPAFWGPGGSYRGQGIAAAPAWARPRLTGLFGASTPQGATPRATVSQTTTPRTAAPAPPSPAVAQAGPAQPAIPAPVAGPAAPSALTEMFMPAPEMPAPMQNFAATRQQQMQKEQARRKALFAPVQGEGIGGLYG